MPTFAERLDAAEMMDDFSIVDERLTRALDNLRAVNRFLGGYRATRTVLEPLLAARRGGTLRVLDLATGVGDYVERFVRWGAREEVAVEAVGLDINPATVAYARGALDRALPPALRPRAHLVEGDALALPFEDGAFDVCHTALFTHHLGNEQVVMLLREMGRVARYGLIVNDLHRHPLAYYGIAAIGAVLPVSPMFRHDGPVSVRRAFIRQELHALARRAGLAAYRLRWHWAFRWTLSTIDPIRPA
ncbi:MAG: methyltransferase domain-containing protein [Rhodothermales bacterium]|nr:methyltransferase domain-containing protein [Rhodothermales bacterium]